MELLVLLVLVAVPAAFVAVARQELRRTRERTEAATVEVDVLGVRRHLADGREERIDWDEVELIEVVRANAGPHKRSGGVVLLGGGPERGCLVPLDRASELGVLERLAALPRFDVKRYLDATEVRPPARTTVWER